MRLYPYDRRETAQVEALVPLWNEACGPDLALSPALVAFNSRPATGGAQAGRLAYSGDALVGFVLASALPADPDTSPPEIGWIDALAVAPSHRRRGAGSALLAWAESWLAEQGCTTARLGGSLRPFAPGLPAELGTESFFHARGYGHRSDESSVWDVASDLSRYRPDARFSTPASTITARPGDAGALLAFLRREFPGRWRFEFEEFRRMGGRMSEYLLLWRQEAGQPAHVDGFCRIRWHWHGAVEPLDRYFLHRLPTPWGQLGPIGVGTASRGQRLGTALLDCGLRQLRSHGVRGCVIDWTTLLDFYAKFGFTAYREYRLLVKNL